MSIVYLVALTAVCVVFLGVLLESLVSVARKPVWPSTPHTLTLVQTLDRRDQQLPFVGHERRDAEAEAGSARQLPRQLA